MSLNITSNASHFFAPSQTPLHLVAVTYSALVIGVAAVLFNGLFIVAYASDRRIRTPFTVYLLNLALADIGFALFEMSGRFVDGYYGSGHWPLGRGACTFWLYCQLIFPAAQVNSVLLLSLDRLVAVYWAAAYRKKVTACRSRIMVTVMWIWLNLYHIPGLVVDRGRNNRPVGVCTMLYDQFYWALWMNILIYVMPQMLLVAFCGLLGWKIKRQFGTPRATSVAMSRRNVVVPVVVDGVRGRGTVSWCRTARKKPCQCGNAVAQDAITFSSPATKSSFAKDDKDVNPSVVNTGNPSPQAALSHPTRLRPVLRRKIERRGFWMLIALTTVVTVLWAPASVYYFMLSANVGYNPIFESVQLILAYFVTFLNPLLYHALNHGIRRAALNLFTSIS